MFISLIRSALVCWLAYFIFLLLIEITFGILPEIWQRLFDIIYLIDYLSIGGSGLLGLSILLGNYFGKKYGRFKGWLFLDMFLIIFIQLLYYTEVRKWVTFVGFVFMFAGLYYVGKPSTFAKIVLLLVAFFFLISYLFLLADKDIIFQIYGKEIPVFVYVLIFSTLGGLTYLIFKVQSLIQRNVWKSTQDALAWPDFG